MRAVWRFGSGQAKFAGRIFINTKVVKELCRVWRVNQR